MCDVAEMQEKSLKMKGDQVGFESIILENAFSIRTVCASKN